MAVEANFNEGSTKVFTQSLSQYDKGQKLIFTGLDLPDKFEAHFSNNEDGGVSIANQGANNEVMIPNAYLLTGEYIYVWVYAGADDERNSAYEVVIPVIPRPAPITLADLPSGGDEKMDYTIEPEEENVNFHDVFLRSIFKDIEEE